MLRNTQMPYTTRACNQKQYCIGLSFRTTIQPPPGHRYEAPAMKNSLHGGAAFRLPTAWKHRLIAKTLHRLSIAT